MYYIYIRYIYYFFSFFSMIASMLTSILFIYLPQVNSSSGKWQWANSQKMRKSINLANQHFAARRKNLAKKLTFNFVLYRDKSIRWT